MLGHKISRNTYECLIFLLILLQRKFKVHLIVFMFKVLLVEIFSLEVFFQELQQVIVNFFFKFFLNFVKYVIFRSSF